MKKKSKDSELKKKLSVIDSKMDTFSTSYQTTSKVDRSFYLITSPNQLQSQEYIQIGLYFESVYNNAYSASEQLKGYDV